MQHTYGVCAFHIHTCPSILTRHINYTNLLVACTRIAYTMQRIISSPQTVFGTSFQWNPGGCGTVLYFYLHSWCVYTLLSRPFREYSCATRVHHFFCQSDAIFSLFWLNEIVMLFVVRAHTVSYIVFRFQFLSFALCFVLLLVYGRIAVNSHIHHSDMARVMCVTLRQRNIYCSLKIMNSKPHAIHHFDNGHYLFDKIFVIGPGVFWESHRRLGIIATALATCPSSANLKVLAMHTTRMDDVVIYCCHHSRHIHACI